MMSCFEFFATKWICSMEKLSRENRKSFVSLNLASDGIGASTVDIKPGAGWFKESISFVFW